jgi:cyclopropane fatty-acyl-phospholipid synthase-like methyltransferase
VQGDDPCGLLAVRLRLVASYFKDKGKFRVVRAKNYALEEIATESIDAIVAHGVFEHIYLEGFYKYLETFARVLKPGGKGCFNYNNIMSSEGLDRFVKTLPKEIDERSIVRFYHPESVERLCSVCGLEAAQTLVSESRFAFLTFRKPT